MEGITIAKVLTTALGGLVAGAVGSMLQDDKPAAAAAAAPPAPTVAAEPTPEMPVADDSQVRANQRKATALQARQRGGRQSTILTALDDEKLGG